MVAEHLVAEHLVAECLVAERTGINAKTFLIGLDTNKIQLFCIGSNKNDYY